MRPPSPSIPEKEFILAALKEGLRLDGRSPLQLRAPTLTFGPELGYVDCALGKTRLDFFFQRFYQVSLPFRRAIAQVDAKMVKPTPERPFEGMVTINSELSPMASSEYEPGRWVR